MAESVSLEESDLYLSQPIHQEPDGIPETVDAIRVVLGAADQETGIATTDKAMGWGAAYPTAGECTRTDLVPEAAELLPGTTF